METTGTANADPHRARPRLLDRVREEIRRLHYSSRTERAYVGWIRRYILYHGKRHPDSMGETEIKRFLTHLATARHVSASTQNQALSALLFLYHKVLGKEIAWVEQYERPQRPSRLPVVLTPAEVRALLSKMAGTTWLMAALLYGSGLRRIECCRLRIKDIDFDRREILVRDSKGQKDRPTVVPARLLGPLAEHLALVRRQFERDTAREPATWSSPMRCLGSTPPLAATGPGNGYSRPRGSTPTVLPASAVAITSTRPSCSAPSKSPAAPQVS